MVIIRFEAFAYDVGYRHGEYVMSGGRAATAQQGTVVALTTDEGLTGWGEVVPLGGTYLPAFPGAIRAAMGELAAAVVGRDALRRREIAEAMDAALLEQRAAKSAVDIALWDLAGRHAGLPISDLIGGVIHEDFPLYEAVPLASPEEMVAFIEERMAAGIRRFQLKVGNEPELDAERTRATRAAAPDDVVIVADANGGWDVHDARRAIRLIGDLDVAIEQPCRTMDDSILASRGMPQPLILDECIVTLDDLARAKQEAGISAVNLKFSRVGGFTNALQLRDAAQSMGLKVSMEDTWGGDLASAATSHLAATTASRSLFNVSFFNDWTDGHLGGYQPRSADGRGSAPRGPGLGIEVNRAKLEPIGVWER